jgi:hypothetical protein
MLDFSQLIATLVLFALGLGAGWFWHRARATRAARASAPTLASQLTELRAIGELSVFKAVSKDILTHVDHSFGEFGRKYLSWAFSRKKMAMVFEFEMDFRYDLRSEEMRVELQFAGPNGTGHAVIHLPPCKVEVSIRNLSFYDEQRAKLLPWLLPDLLQGFFDGRFSEEDKNSLIASAKSHALFEAEALATRYRPQVEQSAFMTLKTLTRPLGLETLEVAFKQQARVSGQVGVDGLDSVARIG